MRLAANVILMGALVSGCVGQITTTPVEPIDLIPKKDSDGRPVSLAGVVSYRPLIVIKQSQYTELTVDEKHKTTKCNPVSFKEIVTVPDQEHPFLIAYDHGFLEGYKLGITLNENGILTNVNSESTPDQGKTLQNTVAAVTDLVPLLGVLRETPRPARDGLPNCNTTPRFERFHKLEIELADENSSGTE